MLKELRKYQAKKNLLTKLNNKVNPKKTSSLNYEVISDIISDRLLKEIRKTFANTV